MPDDLLTRQNHAYHYQVIARAITEIDRAEAPLSLDDLADKIGLSPSHFQRVFSQWAGVSPKRYQQYLTLDHAKRLLAERRTTLDTAHAVGLSGSGRLHDLFLTWEAMSPGDYSKKGAGLTISYGTLDTPFGEALAMATDRGLCGLAFTAECGRDHAMADMTSRWPNATFLENTARVAALTDAALGGKAAHLHMLGAPFQIKVWEALLSIPSGQVTTYSDIAGTIGHPKAVRAVGTAVGRNPISLFIPCHRALRKSGGLGGYHWGLPVKRAMLAHEAARADSGALPNTTV
ncbi:MAG: bifunctional helix-turn-helix domain-containing protein/methylated-DNA--[protein]-cysteine S-methyltransferase [Pseudomonadota bacterium]